MELDETCRAFFHVLYEDRDVRAKNRCFEFQQLHLAYGFRQCQNPRDKVYGLLALVGGVADPKPWLTPNYSKSEQEVFYDATCALLDRGRCKLKCLTGAHCGIGAKQWASWVRDFGTPISRKETHLGLHRMKIYNLFDASRGKQASYRYFMAGAQLVDEKPHQVGLGLMGRRVGTVASMCAAIRFGSPTQSEQEQDRVLQEWMHASGVELSQLVDGQEHSVAVSRFWRTMLGGVMTAEPDHTGHADWRQFTAEAMVWLQVVQSSQHDSSKGMHFTLARTLTIAIDGKCYFRTEDGGQGLCYPSVQEGDEIWVVAGSNVPFVLRRADLSDEAKSELRPREAREIDVDGVFGPKSDFEETKKEYGYYSLVGDCYYDGYMHGEAAEELTQPIVLV
jgi:hypothetical protein